MTSIDELKWLADQGALFVLPRGKSKNGLPNGWPGAPHGLSEAYKWATAGNNVGILCGHLSSDIVAVDIDKDFPSVLARLKDFGETARILRDNAPERGKLLYRVEGELPRSGVWKEKSSDDHPAAEMLSKGRYALCPPSTFDNGRYVLHGSDKGIRAVGPAAIRGIWFLVTGELMQDKPGALAPGPGIRSDLVLLVKQRWPTLAVFAHFGRDAHGTQEERGEVRVLGNGGLLVNPNGLWFCFAEGIGGDAIDAWAYCATGAVVDRTDGRAFLAVVNDMAQAGSIAARAPLVPYRNGERTQSHQYAPLSVTIEDHLDEWGYSLAEDETDGTVYVNGQPIDEATRAELRITARDHGYGSGGQPLTALDEMILVVARRNRFHPVVRWLDSLEWDGQNHFARLMEHLHDRHETLRYTDGTERTVIEAFLYRWLLGCIARARGASHAQNPMLVLESRQGLGKSYFANWLCSPLPDKFIEQHIDPHSADHARLLATKWIWEAGELGSTVRRTDREALKRFISQTTVTFRVPYAKDPVTKPVLASFIGTINNEIGFLTDPTGSRRFLSVHLADIDHAYSKDVNVSQLWAQLDDDFLHGGSYRLTQEEAATQRELNEGNYVTSDTREALLSYYEFEPNNDEWGEFTVDVVKHLTSMGFTTNSTKVGTELRGILGYPAKQVQIGGRRGNRFTGIRKK